MKSNKVPLSEIADINFQSYSAKDDWDVINYLDTSSVLKGKIFSYQKLIPGADKIPSRARRRIKDGSILYSMVRPNQEHYAIIRNPKENVLVSTGFSVIDVDKTCILPEYLYYQLILPGVTDYFQSLAEQSASTYPTLNVFDLKSFMVSVPDMPQQKKIVSIISSIDKKILLNEQINDYLLDLAIALFEHALEESRTEVLLGDIVELEDAKRIPLNSRDRARRKGSYPYYGATAIMDYVNDYLFDEIRILLGEDGTVISDDGKPILQYVWGKYWVNNHAHILKASSSYSLETIYVALSRTAINHIVTGAVQMKISQRNLKSLRLTMPEPDTISDLSTLFEMYRQNVDENKELERLRNSLLPKLMSGEIGVSKIDLSS